MFAAKDCAQLGGELAQSFGQDRGICDHGHEIRVTLPARHNMDVQVFRDPRAGDFSHVNADVEPIRLHDFGQHIDAPSRQLHQVA